MGQFYNKEVEASIDIEVLDNSVLQVVGSAYNKTEINKSLRYDLSVIKGNSDAVNKSKNSQEGRFVLEPGTKKNLSTTSINVIENDRTIILLLIYDEEDKIVGKDRKILNGIEGEEDSVEQGTGAIVDADVDDGEEDGFVLKGMVIENTKTKAGGDFYDLFYSSYLARNIDGEKIVKVEEKLAIANNTLIQVVVGDQVVMQFIMNPRNQYLRTMAEQAVYRVNLYFQQLRNQKNQIIRY
ncbi:MAG: CsgE family curli-type amyloid fiber assembly protein [Flavobacteriaceae bacterium]